MSKSLETLGVAMIVVVVVVSVLLGASFGSHIHLENGDITSPECPEEDGFVCPPYHPHACDLDYVLIED